MTSATVPDYLTCQISKSLMIDPVCLTSGNTYERAALLKYFKKNGHIDPISKEKVDPNIMLDNKFVKAASETFLKENPSYQLVVPD